MRGIRGSLDLADGTIWYIEAVDSRAGDIISHLMQAMDLRPVEGGFESRAESPLRQLIVSFDDHSPISAASYSSKSDASRATAPDDCMAGESQSLWPNWAVLHDESENTIRCILQPLEGEDTLALRVMMLSTLIALHTQARGGLLVHGALARRGGWGIILAGPGGVGKTMASQRLPPPWRSLSDDRALIMRDAKGEFQAHPWPTWSDFMDGGAGGKWHVQQHVSLRGLFFLSPDRMDHAERIGRGEALCLLLNNADQSLKLISRDLQQERKRSLHLRRLDSACALLDSVPAHRLMISPNGDFWHQIEAALHLVPRQS